MQRTQARFLGRSFVAVTLGVALSLGGVSLASASGRHDGSSNHDCASGRISHFGYAATGLGGYVSAVTSSSVTVEGWNGVTTTYTINAATTFTEGQSAAPANVLVVGDRVRVSVNPSTPTTALSINIELAELMGKVTAVSGNDITILDVQGFSRTIIVSGATTYTSGNQPATLANVVVGAPLIASGTIDVNGTSLDALSVDVGTSGSVDKVRGTITAVTTSSITVASKRGVTTTFTYTPTTTFAEGSLMLSASNLAVNEVVQVEVNSAAPTTAIAIKIRLTSLNGTVTAVSGNNITLSDGHGFSRTVVVSAVTTYKMAGATATLAAVISGVRLNAKGTIDANQTSLDALAITIRPPVATSTATASNSKSNAHHDDGFSFKGHRGHHGHHTRRR